jgi:hypothetical protein
LLAKHFPREKNNHNELPDEIAMDKPLHGGEVPRHQPLSGGRRFGFSGKPY